MSYVDVADQDRLELLFEMSGTLFPIEEGDIKPLDQVPDISLEQLGMELYENPRFKLFASVVIGNADISDPQERKYRLREFMTQLPEQQIRNNASLCIGPLVINENYIPNGFGVWELLPKDEN